ncbi:MAG: hypothetical protein ACWGSQ_14450 [Longimicrobiales bacterium]
MLSFFLFMLIIFGFISGSTLLYFLVTRLTRRVEAGGDGLTFSMLRDELDSLTVRLGRVEEELEFYKRLTAPEKNESPAPGPAPPEGDPLASREESSS